MQEAMNHFDRVFVKKDVPDNIDEYKMLESERLLDVLSKNNTVASNGEA